MVRILTITLNPALDVNSSVNHVIADRKLRCAPPQFEPGGGGINVSRAIHKLGGQSTALFLGGGHTGALLEELLAREGVPFERLPSREATRESVMIFDETAKKQYRFGFPGPNIRTEEWERCLARVGELAEADDLVVFSGSLPPGVPDDFLVRAAAVVKGRRARLVVDTSGPPLFRLGQAGAFLIKCNLRELSDLAGAPIEGDAALEEAMQAALARGTELLLMTLAAAGAILGTAQGLGRVRAPVVPVVSRVGAGDSTLGGLLFSLQRGTPIADAVRFGAATGAATVMNAGSELCRRADVDRLYEKMGKLTWD